MLGLVGTGAALYLVFTLNKKTQIRKIWEKDTVGKNHYKPVTLLRDLNCYQVSTSHIKDAWVAWPWMTVYSFSIAPFNIGFPYVPISRVSMLAVSINITMNLNRLYNHAAFPEIKQ